MCVNNVEYLEHMTDAYVRVYGKDLDQSFEYSAIGLVNIMYNIEKIERKQRVLITAEGTDLENLLFDWLEKILLLMLIDKIVLSEFHVTISHIQKNKKFILNGYGYGEMIDLNKHEFKVEVKGITFHEMKIITDLIKNQIVIEYIVDL